MSATLEASLRLEIAQYQAALAKAKGDAVKFKESIKREGDGLGANLFGPLKQQFAGLLPAMGVAAVVGGIHAIYSEMDDLADAATKLGTTPETFQRVQQAAEILGNTDMDTVTSALIRLRRQLVEDPGGNLAKGLAQVGVNAQEFLRLDVDQQLVQLADAFRKAQADGVALPLLNEAFGRSFKELIPLLAQGGAGLETFFKNASVLSNEAVGAAADLNDQFDILIKKSTTLGKSATLDLVDGLKNFYDIIVNHEGTLDEWLQKKVEIDKQAAIGRNEKREVGKAAREAEGNAGMGAVAAAKQATKNAGLDKQAGGATKSSDPFAAVLKGQQQLDDATRRMQEDQMTREEKIAALKARITAVTTEPADPFGPADPAAALDAATRKVELQRELNGLLKAEAEQHAQMIKQIDDEAAADAEKFQGQQDAKKSLAEELQMAAAKASGNTDLLAQMERELKIREKAKQIQDQLGSGITAQQARASAAMIVGADDAAAPAGADGKKGMRRRMMGGGVGDFNRLQSSAFGAGSLSRGSGSLADRAAVAAGNQDARDKKDTSGLDLGSKILATLSQVLLGS